MSKYGNKLITTGIVAGLGLAAIPALAFATGISGDVQLNTEVSTSIAMKIASPNDTNPDCIVIPGSDVTYGTANRYATSNGAEGSKQVDTFDGTTGGADELNTNTSCATLTMTPNTFDTTYSDVTVYTNSPNGYALSLRSATGASPNLVNLDDDTVYIPAGALTEVDGTVDDGQGGTTTAKVVPGGQNKWAYKTDNNGNIDSWTAVTTSDATIRAYDMETNNGSNTRVTYGISAGNNPNGRYGTTLTYTATMFDGANPDVPTIDVTGAGGTGTVTGATLSGDALRDNKLTVPYKATRTLTITPDEGYYLTSFTCPEGFTCSTPTTGSADNPTADARAPQTISITNDSVISTAGTMPITLDNKYRISFSKTNISSPSENYVDVAYGGSTNVTVTPASGYYLSAFSDCPSGWSCSGVSTGTSYTGNQTLTLKNNSSVNTGTITLTGTLAQEYMQGFSCSSLASGASKTLRDSRDNNDYTVKKLADGKCWMTQNLRLVGSRTLTSADSNVSSNFTLTASNSGTWCVNDNSAACIDQSMVLYSGNTSYGTYYNWYAATAGTGTRSLSSGDASGSICPKGWRLPTTIEFQTLYNNYYNSSSAMQGTPAFVLSGFHQESHTYYQGTVGDYWSSTAYGNYNASVMQLASSGPSMPNELKFMGYTVRCVASS